MSSGASCVTGAIQATGAVLNVDKVGFKPRYVRIWNTTDNSVMEWVEEMADDSGFKQKAGTTSTIAVNGITPRNKGFAIGADADLNVDGETLYFVAMK